MFASPCKLGTPPPGDAIPRFVTLHVLFLFFCFPHAYVREVAQRYSRRNERFMVGDLFTQIYASP